MERGWKALAVLNLLMNTEDYLTTPQIVNAVGCERKSIYNIMACLEVNGFHIDVVKKEGQPNRYKYLGLFRAV